jgi:hypothetical protein
MNVNNIQMQYTIIFFLPQKTSFYFYRYLSLQIKVQFQSHLNRVKINVILVTDGFCEFVQFLYV